MSSRNADSSKRRHRDKSFDDVPSVHHRHKQKNIGPFILGEKLGEGSFGVVCVGTHLLTGEKVAIKIMDKVKILQQANEQRIEREIKILKILRHANIIQLFSVIQTVKYIYLVMEYAEGNELFEYIKLKKRLPEREACRFYQQIISGIDYLSKLGIVHRDLKPENLLLDSNKNIKMVDFNLANTYKNGELLNTQCGSPSYAAPEMISQKPYKGVMVDIWSSGVILYAMICGYLPFNVDDRDVNHVQLYKKITEGKFSIPSFVSETGKDLIRNILNTDPNKRFTINQIKRHPWYNMVNPKENMNEGLILKNVVIPVDESIVTMMIDFGFKPKDIRNNVISNRHNHVTTTYYLLLQSYKRKGKTSVSDLVSEQFLTYIHNPKNFFSTYDYKIDKVLSERAENPRKEENSKEGGVKQFINSTDNTSLLKKEDNNNNENINKNNNENMNENINDKDTNLCNDILSSIPSNQTVPLNKKDEESENKKKEEEVKKEINNISIGNISMTNNTITNNSINNTINNNTIKNITTTTYNNPNMNVSNKSMKSSSKKVTTSNSNKKGLTLNEVDGISNKKKPPYGNRNKKTESLVSKINSQIEEELKMEEGTKRKNKSLSTERNIDGQGSSLTLPNEMLKKNINVNPNYSLDGKASYLNTYTHNYKKIKEIQSKNNKPNRLVFHNKTFHKNFIESYDKDLNDSSNIENKNITFENNDSEVNIRLKKGQSAEKEKPEDIDSNMDDKTQNKGNTTKTLRNKKDMMHLAKKSKNKKFDIIKEEEEELRNTEEKLFDKKFLLKKTNSTSNDYHNKNHKNNIDINTKTLKAKGGENLNRKLHTNPSNPNTLTYTLKPKERNQIKKMNNTISQFENREKNKYAYQAKKHFKQLSDMKTEKEKLKKKSLDMPNINDLDMNNNNNLSSRGITGNKKLSICSDQVQLTTTTGHHHKLNHIDKDVLSERSSNKVATTEYDSNCYKKQKMNYQSIYLNQQKPLKYKSIPKEKKTNEKLRTYKGPIDASCFTMKKPQCLKEEIVKALNVVKIFSVNSPLYPFRFKCEKNNIKFELEIFELENFPNSSFIKFKRLEGSNTSFRDISKSILTKII